MGRRANAWDMKPPQLRQLVPGYLYRDRIVTALRCSHLKAGDRFAVTHAVTHASSADGPVQLGPVQSGPFEGAVRHYRGFRFVVAVENTGVGSPLSEKIVNAYLAGAIPIVW